MIGKLSISKLFMLWVRYLFLPFLSEEEQINFCIETSTLRQRMERGELVRFCKNPPNSMDDCNIWMFGIGLFLGRKRSTCFVLCEGEMYSIDEMWVFDAEDFWLPGNPK